MDCRTVGLNCKVFEAWATSSLVPLDNPSLTAEQRGWLYTVAPTSAMPLFYLPTWCQPKPRLYFGDSG